jgi:predicted aspartyl protease
MSKTVNTPLHHLPQTAFRLQAPYVQARLSCVKGDLKLANMLVDTGADVTILDTEAAKAMNIAYGEFTNTIYGVGGSIPVAKTLTEVSVSLTGINEATTGQALGHVYVGDVVKEWQIGGILGRDFLAHYTVTMDFKNGLLILGEPA